MDFFTYRDGHLYAEGVDLQSVAAHYGTPCYVYSRAALETHWRAFDNALGSRKHLICYAVKSNSNLAVLNVLARLGSGFDIVSIGELERVRQAGGDLGRVVFSGVGKRADEMAAALEAGIRCFNVESMAELERLNEVSGRLRRRAPVSLRVNPDIDAHTHAYIATGRKENKFGVDIAAALDWYAHAATLKHIDIVGVDCHIGSQLTTLAPIADALDRLLALVDSLEARGITLRHIDIGGGLGIRYRDETPPAPADYVGAVCAKLEHRPHEILIEPGRAISGNAGILLTCVEYLKRGADSDFAVVDAAMNDLLRPALYQAWQDIIPVQPCSATAKLYDVVGPVCETGDFLGKKRLLALRPGDLLAISSAGAYGFSMSSNYNTRARACEVMVDGGHVHLIRRREQLQDLWAGESLLSV